MHSIRKLAVCGPNLRFADKGCGLKNFILRNRTTLKLKLIILLGSFIEVSLTEREFFLNQKTLHTKRVEARLGQCFRSGCDKWHAVNTLNFVLLVYSPNAAFGQCSGPRCRFAICSVI